MAATAKIANCSGSPDDGGGYPRRSRQDGESAMNMTLKKGELGAIALPNLHMAVSEISNTYPNLDLLAKRYNLGNNWL